MIIKAYLIFSLLIFGFACPYFFSAESSLAVILGVIILSLWGVITEWVWSNHIKNILMRYKQFK